MRNCCIWIFIVLFFASCGQSYQEKQRMTKAEKARLQREDSLSLKVALLPTLDCLPVYIALDRHFFDTLGVDVHVRNMTAQMDCDTALARGRVEGAVSDLFRTERLIRKGTPLTYVAATNTYWQLITNRTARIRRLGQLSDKMVAMTRYSATDYLAGLAIKKGNPKYDVYRIQINDVNVRLTMLLNNEMDAMMLTEPQATIARVHNNPVLFDSRDLKVNLGVIAFRTKALKDPNRKAQLALFVKAYNRACDSINQLGYTKYGDILKKYYKLDDHVIKALPKMTFPHAAAPLPKDINIAKRKS